jgi:hypothetical protein
MTAIGIAFLVFACTFLGALLGMRMRSALPEQHLSDASKDVIHLCMGLIATMTALILGLITASAKSTFDEQDTAVRTAAASVLTLDRTLVRFGPETKALREDLRRALTTAVDRIWGNAPGHAPPASDGDRTTAVEKIEQGILDLSPQNDAQRWLQSQALSLASDVLKARWLSFAGAGNGVPTAFLVVIVFWLTALFWSFGLFAPRNGMVIGVLLLSTASVAASVFLILEMQSPFSGVMKISSAPLQYALAHLGQ